MRNLDYRLSALQILAVASLVLAVIALVRLYHHGTDDYAVPFHQYLGSIRLAVPPILALFVSYILVFISGVKAGDAPRLVIRYLRNRFFQSQRAMLAVSGALVLGSLAIFYYAEHVAPPSYARLVTTLLGAEQDRHTLLEKELKLLEERNPELAGRFRLAAAVFAERSQLNFQHKAPNTTSPRIFVRALEANVVDADWKNHPLRKLALAEAYSMWAQAALSSPLRSAQDEHWKEWLKQSLALNQEVVESPSALSIPLMRFSALNNSGNALLYTNDLDGARALYVQTLAANRNLSSAGNLIAVHILLGELDKAASLGSETREWGMQTGKALTETSSFSSVLVNTAFAYLLQDSYTQATALLLEAYDLESDDLNALNLALSLLLEGEQDKALYVLSRFKYPELEVPYQRTRVGETYDACYYLVRALAVEVNDHPALAAHFYTYLRQARTQTQLRAENAESVARLRLVVLEALQNDRTPCKDLHLIPGLRKRLGVQ